MLSFVRAFATCLLGSLDQLRLELRAELLDRALDVQVRVPHLEVLHPGELAPSRCGSGRPCQARSAPAPSPRKPLSRAAISMLTASRLTSHSHGPGQRLIEIVDIEHQAPLRRGEHPEVRQVRIPAALHVQSRPRRRREVIGHDQRRPAIERKRRDEHPPVADRHELRHPRLRLTLQQRDRISATRRRLELRMIRARHLTPRRLTTRYPLSHRQMRNGRRLRLLPRRGCPAARSGRPFTWSCGRHRRSFPQSLSRQPTSVSQPPTFHMLWHQAMPQSEAAHQPKRLRSRRRE